MRSWELEIKSSVIISPRRIQKKLGVVHNFIETVFHCFDIPTSFTVGARSHSGFKGFAVGANLLMMYSYNRGKYLMAKTTFPPNDVEPLQSSAEVEDYTTLL
jgi:hypothetical protein